MPAALTSEEYSWNQDHKYNKRTGEEKSKKRQLRYIF
jgi:hypothetical protein